MTRPPDRPLKVLLTKIGFDGHARGSRIVAAYLRDAGMEVVYTAPWQSIDAVVGAARDEGVDLIGISSLASDHLLLPKLMAALRDAGLDALAVVVGGIVPDGDAAKLRASGVSWVFPPGSSRETIVSKVRELAEKGRAASAAADGEEHLA